MSTVTAGGRVLTPKGPARVISSRVELTWEFHKRVSRRWVFVELADGRRQEFPARDVREVD